MKFYHVGFVLIFVLFSIILVGAPLKDAWRWNSKAIQFLKGNEETEYFTPPDCTHIWLFVAEARQRKDPVEHNKLMEQALLCSPGNLSVLQKMMPISVELSQMATQQYPNSFQAWFWLGESFTPIDRAGATRAYLNSVEVAPNNGMAWCALGNSYVRGKEFQIASEAFLNCCVNGDPQFEGCYLAGIMMERLGNPRIAIEYFRLSRSDGALERADQLESEIDQR